MPIYEFFCKRCNTVYNFFSARIDPSEAPACPRCSGATTRKPARFATLSKGLSSGDEAEGPDDDLFAGLDEDRLEAVMESMGGELEAMGDNDDPRAMAQIFRRFGEASGLQLGPRMEEMLRRLERGEDPEDIETELAGGAAEGDSSDDDLEDWIRIKKAAAARGRKPKVDETLYFMEASKEP